jgi:hypothetical protein
MALNVFGAKDGKVLGAVREDHEFVTLKGTQ